MVLSMALMFPLILAVLGTFMSETEIYSGILKLPNEITFKNYYKVLFDYNFARYTINTIIVTATTVILAVPPAILAAYPLACKDISFKRIILTLSILGATAPEIMLMIPMFAFMSELRLINNYLAVILPYTAMTACFDVIVFYAYLRGVPNELIEAAYLDGATDWYLLWRIITPLLRPAIASALILTTVFTWNSFILPLVLLPDPDMATLPVGLLRFTGKYQVDIPLLLTGSIITALPMITIYILFQNRVVRGVSFAVR